MSIHRSLKPPYPPLSRTTRSAALCWPRLSPPARWPALNAARSRTGRSPSVISKEWAIAFTTSALAKMFPCAAKFFPTTWPAQAEHSLPVYDAERPRASMVPTCRCAASLSDSRRRFTTSFGKTPRFSIARALRPVRGVRIRLRRERPDARRGERHDRANGHEPRFDCDAEVFRLRVERDDAERAGSREAGHADSREKLTGAI